MASLPHEMRVRNCIPWQPVQAARGIADTQKQGWSCTEAEAEAVELGCGGIRGVTHGGTAGRRGGEGGGVTWTELEAAWKPPDCWWSRCGGTNVAARMLPCTRGLSGSGGGSSSR